MTALSPEPVCCTCMCHAVGAGATESIAKPCGTVSTILEVVPDAEQVISYGLPAFRVRGATVAGFAAFKNHLSYVPFSGSVLGQLGDELEGYTMTKSSLHFDVERPLPKALVKKLIETRLEEADSRSR